MSKRETYEAKTEEILLPIAEENGVEIYDVEYVKEAATGICVPTSTNRTASTSVTARQ